jgi:hypothetical protein
MFSVTAGGREGREGGKEGGREGECGSIGDYKYVKYKTIHKEIDTETAMGWGLTVIKTPTRDKNTSIDAYAMQADANAAHHAARSTAPRSPTLASVRHAAQHLTDDSSIARTAT